ncbi:hypothetical protein EF847_01460 [Actinobacteria bacterium YIM 96077]|uniref:Zinc finger CHC2-type domain-containing protein n=1 Tax=Phytoactinopolyspora halophila TaxID=1981511 RepID=A0A329QFM9_9ACTN|nr:hypothetical protein EF847_01460 [Actinobacteria bacterium YIM 96077]RAW11134.1 hypothetical protein DPM12_17485 [Phytoactinopolyspora halophila]
MVSKFVHRKKGKTATQEGGRSAQLVNLLAEYDVDVIPEHGNQQVRCPWHGEDRTPSASVHYERGLFHCFTCGMAGDVFELLMKTRGMSFGEAVEYAKKSLGGGGPDVSREPTGERAGRFVSRSQGAVDGRGGRWVPSRIRRGADS